MTLELVLTFAVIRLARGLGRKKSQRRENPFTKIIA
jgi:hypothetical protein